MAYGLVNNINCSIVNQLHIIIGGLLLTLALLFIITTTDRPDSTRKVHSA